MVKITFESIEMRKYDKKMSLTKILWPFPLHAMLLMWMGWLLQLVWWFMSVGSLLILSSYILTYSTFLCIVYAMKMHAETTFSILNSFKELNRDDILIELLFLLKTMLILCGNAREL